MGSSKRTSAPPAPRFGPTPYAYRAVRPRSLCPDCDFAVGHQLHRHVPAVPAEVVRVRGAVLAALVGWRCPTKVVEDAELLVSELLTNAIVHGGGTSVTVNVLHLDRRLLIEVTDASPARPAVRGAGPEDERGRGMLLVEAIASAWGSRRELGRGKTTWCTLALDCGATPRRAR